MVSLVQFKKVLSSSEPVKPCAMKTNQVSVLPIPPVNTELKQLTFCPSSKVEFKILVRFSKSTCSHYFINIAIYSVKIG